MHAAIDRRRFLVAGLTLPVLQSPLEKPSGLVLGQPAGARAGMAVLARGGNAVDAIVSAALVAGVVEVAGCGIGGYGGHMVIAPPRGKITAIDFNSAAPAAAREDMFAPDARGGVKDQANTFGWRAAGVPGTMAGLQLALDRHGTRKFPELVEPAIRHAREGFPVAAGLARLLRTVRGRLERDPGSRELFFHKGETLSEGATFRNPRLADLLETLSASGSVAPLYQGEPARRIAAAFERHGGLVTAKDLARYRAREVAPLTVDWRGWTIHTAPLTAGGVTMLQAIRTLNALGWHEWDRNDFRARHALLESLRIAWNDRLHLLGDPEFVKVSAEHLLSPENAQRSAVLVRKALRQKKPLPLATDGRCADGTIHLCACDEAGMMVSLTLTHGGGLGAQVTVEGMGLVLGHGMSRFDPTPGHPNCPGPGKRPLHNMCPTLAVREGQAVLALGGRGGRKIPNSVLGVLLSRIGEGRPLQAAIQAPRLHTEGGLNVTLESTWPAGDVAQLKAMGFEPGKGPGAVVHAIERESGSAKVLGKGR